MEARLLLVRDAVGVLEGKERARDKLLLPEEGGRAHQAAQTARGAGCVARRKAARLPSRSWYTTMSVWTVLAFFGPND